MLKKYSLKTLQKAINKALSLDENILEKIAPMQDKVLKVVVTPLHTHFFISFSDKQLLLLDRYEGVPDTIIHSSPIGLIRLSLLPSSKARSLFNDKISMSGDVELGQQVKQLFDTIDIDWEGHLAQFTGDVVAHQIGTFVRQSLQFGKQFHHSMQLNVTEYLQEELRLVPSKNELDDFYKDIDELSLAVERLQARINLLMSSS